MKALAQLSETVDIIFRVISEDGNYVKEQVKNLLPTCPATTLFVTPTEQDFPSQDVQVGLCGPIPLSNLLEPTAQTFLIILCPHLGLEDSKKCLSFGTVVESIYEVLNRGCNL